MDHMGKRILVIDRSRTVQIVLSHSFSNDGHHVLCATMHKAVEVVLGLDALPHLIFLEIDNQKEAYKVIAAVQKRTDARPGFVAMVLQEGKSDIEREIAQKFTATRIHYLVKPFPIQDALAFVSASIPGADSPGIRTIEREGRT